MNKNFYDRIYGVSLEEYCKAHNITKEELIRHKKIDIALLEKNYKKYASRNTSLSEEELFLTMDIKNYLEHKKRNLERLLKI